jgi:hypothetical protein
MRRKTSHLLMYFKKMAISWMIQVFYFTLHNKAYAEGGFLLWKKRLIKNRLAEQVLET